MGRLNRTVAPMGFRDLASLLTDVSLTWPERLARLQGWRGADAACAAAAPLAQRLAPAVCAVGSAVGAALQSPLVLSFFALTALVGAVAPNHPVEAAYNRWARGRGRSTLPPNRAAKRLGCAIGAVLLGGAAIAYGVGSPTAGLFLAIVLAATATFVAITGVCIPSMIFTIAWGSERGAALRLLNAPQAEHAVTR